MANGMVDQTKFENLYISTRDNVPKQSYYFSTSLAAKWSLVMSPGQKSLVTCSMLDLIGEQRL